MRLLERQTNGDLVFHEPAVGDSPAYAILSHTWLADNNQEISFQDVQAGTGKNKDGWVKIQFCADKAAADGLPYFWIDTCCIDKSSSAELQEAINSMFRWYRNAAICYVYLSDVSSSAFNDKSNQLPFESVFRQSRWFTRGWTLQELLAPVSVEFFSKEGIRLGDEKSLERQIHEITGIPVLAIRGTPLYQFRVNERFIWAHKRKTTREEDWAYSLLGIFDIFMPLIYGEGWERAVIRLRKEIYEASKVKVLEGHSGGVSAMAFSPDGKQLVSASHGRTVRLWDTGSATPLQTLEGRSGGVSAVAFSPDGKQLVSTSDDETVRLWDVVSGAPLQQLRGHFGRVSAVAFSPDGKQLASASDDKTVRLWGTGSGTRLHTLRGHSGRVSAVAFSPDSKQLISTSDDKTVRLWDAGSGTRLHTLEGHSGRVSAVVFSPDSKQLVSASHDKTVRLWDAGSGTRLHTLESHWGWSSAVAFSPDGKQVIATTDGKMVKLWDTGSGTPLRTLRGHSGRVSAVAFSPDSKQLVSTSDDKTVRLWDTGAGTPLQTLEGHSGGVSAVAFSPDGKHLASASSDDGTVRLWPIGYIALF
ncbi:hypothetical protein H2200_013616 [Cladophialophora chaetospira]|uniref:Heterokaryon incompatibility domain-containing protein n=1 Tax=Cladophialophora chaetospira TaxID=386627 RepID=A0AA38WVY9_9EURO|nr:hypothetical protein H2200_013616 [Cladophialophora chaetospira]